MAHIRFLIFCEMSQSINEAVRSIFNIINVLGFIINLHYLFESLAGHCERATIAFAALQFLWKGLPFIAP